MRYFGILRYMLDLLIHTVLSVGDYQRDQFFRRAHTTTHKGGHSDIVTQADIHSQKLIHDTLAEGCMKKGMSREDFGFIGEEGLATSGEHTFVIDPIDGTSNFATGMSEFAVLISYFYQNVLTAGVMYFPIEDILYSSEKGKGVFRIKNNVREKVNLRKSHLEETFLFASLSYPDEMQAGLPQRVSALQPLFRGVRMVGCAGTEYRYLCDGVAGAVLSYGVKVWDIAPGALMARELGYEVYDYQATPIVFDLTSPVKKYPTVTCHKAHKDRVFKHMTNHHPI